MISSGERLMPPSIGLKMSAVICGKSAVVFPAAFASSVGSFFSQPENVRDRQAPTQIPARVRRRRSRLAWRNACTEPSLISLRRTVRQEQFWKARDRGRFASRSRRAGLLASRLPIRQAGGQAADIRPAKLFDEFHFDRGVGVTFVMRLRQKSPDSVASNFAIIASKFIHIHADKFPGEFRVHVARVGKRMSHRLLPMGQTVVDAFANDFAEIVACRLWNIFAHDISAKGQWQSGLFFPPFSKIDNFLEP